jgi:hypothetical protein
LFSFVGKALKTVSKVAGFVPGIGGTISKIAKVGGNLLDHKRPMAKPMLTQPQVARGNVTQMGYGYTPQVLRATPVLPGGAVSTPSGIRPADGKPTPHRFTAAERAQRRAANKVYAREMRSQGPMPGRRKKRTAATKRRSTTRRKSSGRKLKFGSPAWRKKYMKRR